MGVVCPTHTLWPGRAACPASAGLSSEPARGDTRRLCLVKKRKEKKMEEETALAVTATVPGSTAGMNGLGLVGWGVSACKSATGEGAASARRHQGRQEAARRSPPMPPTCSRASVSHACSRCCLRQVPSSRHWEKGGELSKLPTGKKHNPPSPNFCAQPHLEEDLGLPPVQARDAVVLREVRGKERVVALLQRLQQPLCGCSAAQGVGCSPCCSASSCPRAGECRGAQHTKTRHQDP